jgi:actin-related protein
MDNLGGKSINHFFQFIKREHSGPDWDTPKISLDEETLLGQEGLNEAQVELLREELVKREMLPAAEVAAEVAATLTAGPLDEPAKKAKKVKEEAATE